MPFSNKMFAVNKPSAQTIQPHILERFNNPLDCLTAHLMPECAEVLAGVKPADLPFVCQGPWKIYGNPAQSLGLVEQYRYCRQRWGNILASGNHEALELQNPGHHFFVVQLIWTFSIEKTPVCEISGKGA